MELILLAVCALILISNVFVAFVRGTRKSLLRLLTAVIAVVIAFFLSRAIAASFGTEIALWMKTTLGGDPNFAPMFEGEAGADKALGVLVQMLVAPLLFLVLYCVLKAVLIVLYWILSAVTRPETKKRGGHLVALPIGLLMALIGILVFITPVMGYLDVASATVTELDTGESIEEVKELAAYNAEFALPALETPVVSSLYNIVGEKLFDGLAQGKWDGAELHLKAELVALGKVAGNVQQLGAVPTEQYGEAECAAVSALAENIGSSQMLSILCAGVLNTASNHWLEGESFLGVLPPDMGANGNMLLDSFLQVFATSSRENLGEDLDFFADAFTLVVRYDLLASVGSADENELAELITDSGLLSDMQDLLATHPRMKPVGTALIDIGMRSALHAMGLPEDLEQSHSEMLTEITTVLKEIPTNEDGSINEEALAEDLTTVFESHEIEVSESVVTLVAHGVADHFTKEELEELSTEELVGKLAERFHDVDISDLELPAPQE